MLRAIHNFLAVVRPERPSIVANFVSQLLHVFAIGVHGVDVEIAVARGSEDDVLAVASNGGLRVVAARVGEQFEVAAIGLGGVDAIGVINRPDVAARIIRFGWAFCAGRMSGGKEDAIAGGKEIAAGGAALSGAQQFRRRGLAVGRVHRNGIDLIARNAGALMLKNQLPAVGGEVGLGI